jgi:CHAT domain-containing protein
MSALAFLRERAPPQHPPRETAVLVVAPQSEGALAGIAREVRYLRSRFEGVEVARGLPGGAAGLAGAAAGCGVLHIAAHAEANDEKPWQSSIDLGGARAGADEGGAAREARPAAEGGLLRASDIAALRLDARLAVLSGCETASGRATSGEGVLGLTSAFLSAGVSAAVATLWPVEDRATARLMTRFYAALGEGADPAAALREAALDERARRGGADASFWAAFVLVGAADEPVALVRANTGWPSMVLLLGILVPLAGMAGGLAWLRRRRRPLDR